MRLYEEFEESSANKLLRTVPIAVIANAAQRSVAILLLIWARARCLRQLGKLL